MKANQSPERPRRERANSTHRKPSLSCFNARIDFLNNLSDGIVKKLPKQRKTSHARELEMPLPPGCFPEKVTYALSQSSSNLVDTSVSYDSNTISTTMESYISPSEVRDDFKMLNRADSWYVQLSQTSEHNKSPRLPAHKTFSSPQLEHRPSFKRLTRIGSSLKLQNGSYPLRYKKKVEESQNTTEQEKNKPEHNITNTIQERTVINENESIKETANTSLTESSISEDSSHTDTLSSELFDPLSEKIGDPFSRSSSVLSKTPSLRSNSVFSIDSTYGTSEFNHNNNIRTKDAMFEFDRLSKVLDHIDGETLRQHLKSCLESKKPKTVKLLNALLPRNKFNGQTTHCVRCHSEYDKDHGNMTCILRHPTDDVVLISEDGQSALFQCDRCACVFKLDGTLEYSEEKTDLMNCGACFTGRHTNRAENVDFEPEGFAKLCTDKECAIFYV